MPAGSAATTKEATHIDLVLDLIDRTLAECDLTQEREPRADRFVALLDEHGLR